MTARFVTCNAHGGAGLPVATPANKRATVLAAAKRADVLNLQEADDVSHAALLNLSDDWEHHIPVGYKGANTVSWRKSVFKLIAKGSNRIYSNAPGVDDGPNRSMTWAVLEEIATGEQVIVISLHLIHQAFTSHPERAPAWRRMLAEALVVLGRIRAKYPKAAVAASGDWNNGGAFTFYGTEVKSPPTYEGRRYDRWFLAGAAPVGAAESFVTESDHDGLLVRAALGAKPVTPPKPPPVVVDPPVVVSPPPSITEKLFKILNAEVGYHEGRSGGHWNNRIKYAAQVPGLGWADGQPWCATFASWAYLKAGLRPNVDFPVTASCDAAGAWYKKHGRWSEYPAIGAQALYGSPSDLNHTGIVVSYDATHITVIEGNTNANGSREGDGVYRKVRLRRATSVVGYGYPLFPVKIVSADPKWSTGHPGSFPPPTSKLWPIDGIDLSHWNNKRIDWAKAKHAGVKFAAHKATEHTAMRDMMYAPRRAEIRAAGVLFLPYHFARPSKSSGLVQARFHLATAKPRHDEGRVMLDLEDRGRLDIDGLDAWVEDFKDEVKAQTGKNPIIYTKFNLRSRHGCYLWTARYSPTNAAPIVADPWDEWDIHQFSNGIAGNPHTVPGVPMAVDINTLRPGLDLADLKIA